MFKRWSLSARLVSTVAVTIAAALLLFAGLTAFRLQEGAGQQKRAVADLARERIDAQLELEVQLASSFLERIANDVDVAVAGLAERSETPDVVKRGNIVEIDLLMQKVVRTGPLEAVLVLDTALNALGSHQPGLDLLVVNKMFAGSPIAKRLRALLREQEAEQTPSYHAYEIVDPALIAAAGLAFKSDGLLLISAHPVFDDFGDVMALLVGLRTVNGEERVLQQFAKTWELSIQVFDGEHSVAVLGGQPTVLETRDMLSRCAPFAKSWKLCVGTPRAKLTAQTQQLVANIEREKTSLLQWLFVLCLASLLVASLLASVVTRRVLAPLNNITRVVRSVAKGNWLARVAGQKRRDEVGEIARAVVVLQRSVKEREQLQASVADVEQVLQQRRDLTDAMQACRSVLRRRLFSLSDATDQIEQQGQQLVGLGELAEGEADEARLVALRALSRPVAGRPEAEAESAKLIRDAIERFSETAAHIGSSGQDMSEHLNALVADVRGLDHVVKRFLGDLESVPELPGVASASETLEKT